MHRVPRLQRLAFGPLLLVAAGCSQPGPELRVELSSELPAGTKQVYAALTMSPTYCAQYSGKACTEVFDAEFEPSDAHAFRLSLPDELRAFDNASADSAVAVLRVEARGEDRCMLARATRTVPKGMDRVTVELDATSGSLCTLVVAVHGSPGAGVTWGQEGACPQAIAAGMSTGLVCAAEVPKGSAVTLHAATDPNGSNQVFDSWLGFADCVASAKPDCAVPMNGPAAVRAEFRPR